jgi:hypothetical protein
MFKKIMRRIKKIFCKHDKRIISFYPDSNDTYWHNVQNKNSGGKHETIVINGCLKCGKMWMEDYGL